MAQYQVTCTVQEPANQPESHAHIVQVGAGDRMWAVDEVIWAKGQGHRFFTVSPGTGREARVNVMVCDKCGGGRTLRSSGDIVEDNNIDNLPRC